MNYFKLSLIRGGLFMLLLTAGFSGCKKAEVSDANANLKKTSSIPVDTLIGDPPLEPPYPPVSPDVDNLKAYMSSLVNVSVSEITYDPNSQQFMVFGVSQISLADLTNSYNDNGSSVE